MPDLGLSLGVFFSAPLLGDSTPGGVASAWLLEDGVFGFLIEDASSAWLIET